MKFKRQLHCCMLALCAILAQPAIARSQKDRPLSEANLTKLIELRIEDDAIAGKLRTAGVAFAIDDALIKRLKEAGASDTVIAATRTAARPQGTSTDKPVTYQDVLKLVQLGLQEEVIMKRLEKSPTLFTLDAIQVAELKRAGASENLLKAMQEGRPNGTGSSPKITDFAVVLDCSGSMGEQTRDGQVKIDVAKRVVSELVSKMPVTLRVAFIVYGYDRDLNCQAVSVMRPLSELVRNGKAELASLIDTLRPVANTPIALALEVAGRELAKNDAPCGLVLLSDGKETCGGDPAAVASTLVGKLRLSYGINVIGFDVQNDERASLTEIARAGKGKYYNAQTAAELVEVIRGLQKELEIVAQPAPTGTKVHVATARLVEIQSPSIELPQLDAIYLARPGTDRMALRADNIARISQYAQRLRIPPTVKIEKFDLWWVPEHGRAIKMVKDLAVGAEPVAIKPQSYLGLVRLTGKNLPAANVILVTPVGTQNFATRALAVQSTTGFGKDMVVAPGQYDVWIEPADGGKSEKVAERIEVSAGKVAIVD